jgi:hypothetical protein
MGIALLAYVTADGVVQTAPVTFRTEFANPTWLAVTWLLLLPVWFAGRAAPTHWRAWAALAAVPQWVLAVRVVQRYQQTGWSDGLETFACVGALAITYAFVVAARTGADSRQGPT